MTYLDASASVADRVTDLLGQMTLDEKLAQLGSAWVFQLAGADGFDAARATPLLANGIGHVTRISGATSLSAADAATLANDVQRHLREHTRLGIPAIVHEEICSGLMARDATAFPQAIGVASTFRPELNQAMADAIRRQMRSVGAHQGLSPVLDICRDPRWGRLEETYGEDPYLVTQMGLAFVGGLQGDDLTDGVVATAKHFVGYGASEGGLNWAPAHLPERELRDVYLRPFEAAVRDGGVGSVMNAYHELDGVPCGASRWLLTDLLRGEWGFAGSLAADYFTVRQLSEYHRVAATAEEAAALALSAGIDIELPSTDCYGDPLRASIERGDVGIDLVDAAVGRALATKFQLGPVRATVRRHRSRPTAHPHAGSGRARPRRRRRQPRPLEERRRPAAGRGGLVAVIGPNAASGRNLLGDYAYIAHVESLLEVLKSGRNVFAMPVEDGVHVESAGAVHRIPTILDALVAQLPDATLVHIPGCAVNDGDRSGFAAAVDAAARSDVAVLVMGERSGLTDECTTGESRDVASLDLPGVQEELVLAVAATGTPVVLVLVAGRPIGSEAVHRAAGAVLMAWLPGEHGARAVAEALAGARSPGGKLPVTYPRSSGQIPTFYGHKASGGRSHWKGAYVDLSNEPMYPFGHGLSYSRFDVVLDTSARWTVNVDDVVDVVAKVRNAGAVRSDEVVQLYSRDPIASITRPVLELQGFAARRSRAGWIGACSVPPARRLARVPGPRHVVCRRAGRDRAVRRDLLDGVEACRLHRRQRPRSRRRHARRHHSCHRDLATDTVDP